MRVALAMMILAPVALTHSHASAQSQLAIPDMTGKWIGRTYSIIAGHGGHWPESSGTFASPARGEIDLTISVRQQDGRRFWGTTTTISKDGKKLDEPFIGELSGPDGSNVIMADTDGLLNGHLTGDVLAFCYAQPAVKGPAVVSCTEVRRSR